MSAIPKPVLRAQVPTADMPGTVNASFLKFLPAVETHAKIQFRHLPPVDREDAISESVAAAFLNFKSAYQRGRADKLTPSTVAKYAILHARTGRHVGGSDENTSDVLSRRAQMKRGFEVLPLPAQSARRFNCLSAPDEPVWREVLRHDRQTPVLDQVRFRHDFSAFLSKQTDRMRQLAALLAAGHRRSEAADRLGITAPAVTQRLARLEKEWTRFCRVPVVTQRSAVDLNAPPTRSGGQESPRSGDVRVINPSVGDHPNRSRVGRQLRITAATDAQIVQDDTQASVADRLPSTRGAREQRADHGRLQIKRRARQRTNVGLQPAV